MLALCSVTTSIAFIIVSIFLTQPKGSSHEQPLDGNFYALLSQAILSLFAVYLTALPPLRSRALNLRYKSWFWGSSMISVLASIISLGIYRSQSGESAVLAYVASFTQVVNTLLLIECVEEAVQAGSIGGVDMG